MKYIDADKLKAAIEKGTPDELEFRAYRDFILYLIDDLRQEQTEVDLKKEIDKEWEKCNPVDEGMGVETANVHIEQFDIIARNFVNWGAEQFAKIVRANLSEIGKNAQSQFEQLYLEITGNKMYGGYND